MRNGKGQIMESHQSKGRWDIIFLVALGVVLPFLLNGCGSTSARTIGRGIAPRTGQISKEELRERLDTFREFFKATLRRIANELNERVPTTRTEKTTLQMRARMVQSLSAMLDQDDPVVAFIETWALCTRFRIYLEEGEGSSLFGEGQEVALNGARRLEKDIERIGNIFLKEDVFDMASKNVTQFAHNNPIRGTFSNVLVYATEVREEQPNPFLSVLKVPMTPFRALEGVDRTASAIHQFRDTAERFSDIVAELPESSRWQLQLLLYDLEETDMTKSFLNSLSQVAESSRRLEESVKKLPDNIREQLVQFVEEVDRKQSSLQNTLQQAEKNTLAVNASLDKLVNAAGALDATAVNITETAQAWENAARATGHVVEEFNKSKESPKEEASFNIKEYRDAAEQTSQAANDIKNLLAAAESFPGSPGYKSIVNQLSLRGAGLVLLIFVLAVLYRMITVRLMKLNSKKPSR